MRPSSTWGEGRGSGLTNSCSQRSGSEASGATLLHEPQAVAPLPLQLRGGSAPFSEEETEAPSGQAARTDVSPGPAPPQGSSPLDLLISCHLPGTWRPGPILPGLLVQSHRLSVGPARAEPA